MRNDKRIRASYNFLIERARNKNSFKVADLVEASKWTGENTRANISKRLKQFLIKTSQKDTYKVKINILDIPYHDYLSLFKQADILTPPYTEYRYSQVIIFELFLPLSCEDKLRRALDKLFYKDTVLERFQGVGLEKLRKIIKQQRGEGENSYLDRVCGFVAKKFGGYSISHVNGRFRTGGLLSKIDAFNTEGIGDYYLIDETTAIVKFIVPIHSSESLALDIQEIQEAQLPMNLDLKNTELEQIEWLFRNIFISAILNTVGQEEILVLESGVRYQLNRYVAESKDN